MVSLTGRLSTRARQQSTLSSFSTVVHVIVQALVSDLEQGWGGDGRRCRFWLIEDPLVERDRPSDGLQDHHYAALET